MKHLSYLVLLLLYSSSLFSQEIQQQLVLESILSIKPISELLSLDSTNDRGGIRIFARTKKLKENYFLLFNQLQPTSIPLQVLVRHNYYPVDINTGYHRDLFIYKYEKRGSKIRIELYLSNYKCIYEKKTRYSFDIEVEISGAACIVKSYDYNDW